MTGFVLTMFKHKLRPTNDAIVLTKGIDSYLRPGSSVTQLAMQTTARSQYFEQCLPLVSLLLRDDINPLVEEGVYIEASHRARQGEFYLIYEAIALLVEKKIRHHKPSKNSLPYDSRNIYIIKNDPDNLEYILTHLNLEMGRDAKIIYVSGVHSIPFYLRNQQGQIRCFLVDSEAQVNGLPDDIIYTIQKALPPIDLVVSTTTLQRDFYSCSTFAIKALMYFVKHGDEVFTWIDKVWNNTLKTIQQIDMGEVTYKTLNPDDLMPVLLKMAQTTFALSSEVLASIVSSKKKMTLDNYFKYYHRQFDGKKINTAALVKKYNYFTLLNNYLQQITQDVSFSADTPLPKSMQKRVDNYTISHHSSQKESALNPIDTYLDILSFLKNNTPLCNSNSQNLLAMIQIKCPAYRERYADYIKNHIIDDINQRHINQLFFVAAFSEATHESNFNLYGDFAVKLRQVFLTYASVVEYLKRHASSRSRQPVHDLCLFAMPESPNWNKAYWADLMIKYGAAATRYLTLASQIDALLIEHADEKKEDERTELAWIKYLLEHFFYQQAYKNRELAALCVAFQCSEAQFEKGLALVNNRLKAFDFLPEITLHGVELDSKLAKFTFAKLPINDLRGLFLGEYTSCCQSFHKVGADCVIHGMTSPFGGFYVVYDDKGVIVAQSWVWIGKKGEIVFDSWEYINKNQAYLCQPFILKAAEQFVNRGFTRVLIGCGGHTPSLPFKRVNDAVIFPLSNSYSDAYYQYLVQNSPYQTLLTRFQVFAKDLGRQDLYDNYHALMDKSFDTHAIIELLSKLIMLNNMPFDDFFHLIQFLYSCRHDVLHKANQALWFTVIHVYGAQMLTLLTLKTIKNHLVSDALIALNDVGLLMLIMTNTIGYYQTSGGMCSHQTLFESLFFSAIYYDALDSLIYLSSLFKQWGSFDELAALVNHKNEPLLFYAAKHNAFRCLEFILANMRSSIVLARLLYYDNQSDITIMPQLAKANQLTSFKLIEHLCGGNEVIPALLDKHSFYRYFECNHYKIYPVHTSSNIKIGAFMSGSYDFLRYVLANWSGSWTKQQQIQYVLHNDRIKPDTLYMVMRAGDINALIFLKSMHDNQVHWLASLLSSWENPLQTALQARQFASALFLIDSLSCINHWHQLLTHRSLDKLPLDNFTKDNQSNDFEIILRKILAIYAGHRDKANDLFCTREHGVLFNIIMSKNHALFKDVLVYLASDEVLFEAILCIDNSLSDKDNLLDKIISIEYANQQHQIVTVFIDILFEICSLSQQKKMLLGLRSLPNISSQDVLNFILEKVNSIDDRLFQRQWATFEKNGPLGFFLHHENKWKELYRLKPFNSANEVRDYNEVLIKIDKLRALKKELSLEPSLQPSPLFFKPLNPQQKALNDLLATFNDTLFYFDKTPEGASQCVFVENQVIDDLWLKVQSILADMAVDKACDGMSLEKIPISPGFFK